MSPYDLDDGFGLEFPNLNFQPQMLKRFARENLQFFLVFSKD